MGNDNAFTFLEKLTDNSVKKFDAIQFGTKNNKQTITNSEFIAKLGFIKKELDSILCDEKKVKDSLVLFGEKEYEHNTNDYIFKIEDSKIITGNVVGTINFEHKGRSRQLIIGSRFGDTFLKSLITYTNGFLEVDYNASSIEEKKNTVHWLLIYYWKYLLKKASRLGLPKSYVTKREALPIIRGNLDINKSLVSSIVEPKFLPPYPCHYREHSYDNDVTQIIASTLDKIDSGHLNDCRDIYVQFKDIKRIKNGNYNFKPIQNPYFAEYNKIAQISQLILRNTDG